MRNHVWRPYSHPTFHPFFPIFRFGVFPVDAEDAGVATFELYDSFPVVAAYAVDSHSEIFGLLPGSVENAVVEPPAADGASLETVAANAFGVVNLGRPNFYVFPNICSFPRHSSSVAHIHEGLAGNSIDFPANDAPDSHFANLGVCSCRMRECVDNSSSRNHNAASDTSLLPTDATTIRHKNRSPPLRQGRHKRLSQATLSTQVEQ